MEDTFDYLIRTLGYKRSCLELEMKKIENILKNNVPNNILFEKQKEYVEGEIMGLSIAITELYKLLEEK